VQPRPPRSLARLKPQPAPLRMSPFRILGPVALLLALPAFAAAPDPREAKHLAVLSSEAGVQEKARACQELASIAGPASVPALAALLGHEQLGDYARSGLESIPDASAGAALRKSLGSLKGRQLAGAVNSLGVRRETAAVSDLQKLATDPGRGVAEEALASLGMIGNSAAAKALQKVLADGPANLRVPAAHAALVAAEHLTKAGDAKGARSLLDAVARALPDSHIGATAKARAAAR